MKKILLLIAMVVSCFTLTFCSNDDDNDNNSTVSYEENRKAGEKYLAENAKREGVTETSSKLQYEVLQDGEGKRPSSDRDTVKCHYTGYLIDGTIFDSSYNRGTPSEFVLNQVIKGWTEGLQLMKEGSKYRFYIPYDLAYGSHQVSIILPYSALIFDVELIEVKQYKNGEKKE